MIYNEIFFEKTKSRLFCDLKLLYFKYSGMKVLNIFTEISFLKYNYGCLFPRLVKKSVNDNLKFWGG